ncbi:hypothetical protein ANN_14545 [Periplaneta americana]|uniref:Reverse transcriptase domain-containing protein n=1 Tax=Periplaneta americana TaxID=6978 RepID=A0ABQ8SWK6_PERAM|nr:hypothetical protein ANN_14545 [Periplaneta americana]
MLGENPQTIRENAEILVEASKAIELEVNPEKTKYMIMSRDQNIIRNGNIKIGDLSFEEFPTPELKLSRNYCQDTDCCSVRNNNNNNKSRKVSLFQVLGHGERNCSEMSHRVGSKQILQLQQTYAVTVNNIHFRDE